MPWLVGGPYTVDGPDDIIEVSDADGSVLLAKNPAMFRQATGPAKVEPPRLKCPHCDRDYANQHTLDKHVQAMHIEHYLEVEQHGDTGAVEDVD